MNNETIHDSIHTMKCLVSPIATYLELTKENDPRLINVKARATEGLYKMMDEIERLQSLVEEIKPSSSKTPQN